MVISDETRLTVNASAGPRHLAVWTAPELSLMNVREGHPPSVDLAIHNTTIDDRYARKRESAMVGPPVKVHC